MRRRNRNLGTARLAVHLRQQALNLRIRIPAPGALAQDEIRAHAAAGEILDPLEIFGSIRVRIEVPRSGVADVLEELHEPEGGLHVGRSEPEVLIVPAGHLVVQIDVKQLAGLPGLRHRVQHVQTGHLLVRHFRIHADHLRVRERLDESQVRARRRHVDVAARLVGLRLEGKLETEIALDRVLAQVIDRFAETLDRFVGTPARVGFGALAASPQHEDLRAKLCPEIHRGHRLLQRVRTDPAVVCGKRAIAEHRVVEQVHGRHRHHDAVPFARAGKLLHDPVALGCRRVDWDQIVVVQVDAPRPDLRKHRDGGGRRKRIPDRITEWIAAAVADRPQSKRELVLTTGRVRIRHSHCVQLKPLRPANRLRPGYGGLPITLSDGGSRTLPETSAGGSPRLAMCPSAG